jgi:gliding motility-associated-like protein
MWNGNPLDNQSYKVVNGTQQLTLQVGNDNGCTATDVINMTALPQPVVNIPDQTVCSGMKATLTASGFSSVKWSTGETTPAISVTKGTYEVEVTDANNCKNKDVAAVSWYPIPNADLGDDVVICPVETADLTAPTGPAPLGYNYLWSTGASSQTITVNQNGVYEVEVTDLSNNCKGYDNITVWFPIPQTYELAPVDPVCDNQKAGLDAGDGYLSYEWSDGITNQVDSVSVPGDYISKVFDGCFFLQDTVTVTFIPTPVINALDTMVYSQVVVDASGGTAPLQYALNQGNYQDKNVFVKVPNGTHQIEVIDANNCVADTTFTLNSNLDDLTIPNFFTPNGDGFNDTWKIEGLERLPEACIKIYDRYGKLLVLMKPEENGWDGTYLSKPVASDDYWYVVELLPTSKLIKGHFTVKR